VGRGDVTIVLKSPNALRRMLYSPDELGFARAYVSDELDIEGSMFELLQLRDRMGERTDHIEMKFGRMIPEIYRTARSVGAIGRPLPPPPEEARSRGRLHSLRRDAAAISHHYDVGNDFYRLVLGPTMTYSCAYFPTGETGLDAGQDAKHELVCRKLGLAEGMRLLDVGCGWGGMVIHAAQHHGVDAVGVTLSHQQAELARKRVAEAGLEDRIEIRYRDYREVADGPFDAISSIGMFEHVGDKQLGTYFEQLYSLLRPGGRLLNHAISRPSGPASFDRRSFISRYVFPDGELHEVGRVVSAMQDRGLEVRDVESLREHYARTLRFWVANLEGSWDEAVALAGRSKAKIWRLYMAGSALGFEAARLNVHQVLGIRPDAGNSHMPPTRSAWG
jgi:cyclopropane-fatty-acyl-phospholipid synthase